MKNILFGFYLLSFSLAGFAQDAGVGSSVEEFRANVQQNLQATRKEIEMQISSRRLDFSDYKEASQQLLQRIDQSSHHFKKALGEMEDFLSWYDSVSSASKSKTDNRALKRLLDLKKAELKVMREHYKKSAQLYVMLGSHLSFPVKWKQYDHISGSRIMLTNIFNTPIYDLEANIVGRAYGTAEEFMHRILSTKSESIFSACKTQGCIVYIAEDIAYWIKASQKLVSKLEVPVKGVCDLEASKMTNFNKVQTVLDDLANIAAQGKPVSVQ